MVITYQGVECFKVQFGDIVIAFNPISKESKFKSSRFGADVVLISANNKDLNGAEMASFGDRAPLVVTGPGEYETKGVFIRGFLSSTDYGGENKINTIYTVSLEGMNLCFLGALNKNELPNETKEALDEIDILFVPIGGDGVFDAKKAYEFAVDLEPKIIIPMHYGDIGEKGALQAFLKSAGENISPVDKLTLKKKDLEGKEGEVVVLASS